MKTRIIIGVFVVVAVFYFAQLLVNFMSKKEHFSTSYFDDVERYEDAPPPKAEDNSYKLRIFLLDEIDKLGVSDKSVKGNIMETLFSESKMKELESKTKEERIAIVKKVYEDAKPAAAPAAIVTQETAVATDAPTQKTLGDQAKAYFENIDMPEIKDYYQNQFQNVASQAGEKLDVAISSLKDIKDILQGKFAKEPYVPDLPVAPKLPGEQAPKKPVIEGFENIRSFAFY